MSWTEPKIQMLKEMWGHGHSASDIAKRLGGMSRNAVIGKAHRLKLSVQAVTSRGEGASLSGLASAIPVVKSQRKRVMLRPLPAVPVPSSSTVKALSRDVSFRPAEAPKRVEGISVTKAGERHCRWPVGDPRSPDFRFCGCTAHESLPYCVDHARVAYQNIGRKQRSFESNVMSSNHAGA